MRLQQHINESITKKYAVKGVLTNIYDKCMPFINDLLKSGWNYAIKGDTLMYSGRLNDSDDYIEKSVRNDRRPLTTKKEEHQLLDELFKKKFGWKARSNSIFCTGDKKTAMSYGTLYAIFPIGEYKFLWNKDIHDLFTSFDFKETKSNFISINRNEILKLSKYSDSYDLEHLIYTKSDRKSDLWKEYKQEIFFSIISKYSDKNIAKAIKSKNEIMINCKKYIGIKEMYEKDVKMYMSEMKLKYPDNDTFNSFWERWGGL